jgi:hypothetical protein
MALQKNYDAEFGLNIKNAYFCVSNISGSKHGAIISVDVYVDSNSALNGMKQLSNMRIMFTPRSDGESWDAQAYQHLKTLPEFEGAIDC